MKAYKAWITVKVSQDHWMRLCSTSHIARFWWFVEATSLVVDFFGCQLMAGLGMKLTHCSRLLYALCKQAWERPPHDTWAQSYRPRPQYCPVRYTLQHKVLRSYAPAGRGGCSAHAGTVRWRCMENSNSTQLNLIDERVKTTTDIVS